MSLLKQLFLAICLFLVVAFSGSFVSSVENSREQLRGQLRSHAQDAATALGLSLTPHVDDPAMVQLMVSSIFDSGYFASIAPQGEVPRPPTGSCAAAGTAAPPSRSRSDRSGGTHNVDRNRRPAGSAR